MVPEARSLKSGVSGASETDPACLFQFLGLPAVFGFLRLMGPSPHRCPSHHVTLSLVSGTPFLSLSLSLGLWTTLIQDDIIWRSYLNFTCKGYFQIRSHVQVLGVRTWTYVLEEGWETQFNPLQVQPFRWLCSQILPHLGTTRVPGDSARVYTQQSGPFPRQIPSQDRQASNLETWGWCVKLVHLAFSPMMISEWALPVTH